MESVAIVVPVYNAELYIRNCIDSLLKQSGANIHIIIINDGSTDSSDEILNLIVSLYDRITLISTKNFGAGHARNKGIDYSLNVLKTQWITFVDADDIVLPNYVKTLLYEAVCNKVQISMCECHEIYADKQSVFEELSNSENDTELVSPETIWCLYRADCVVPWEKMYSADIFKTGLRYPTIRYGEDEDLSYKALFSQGLIAYVHSKLYIHYKMPDSMMRSSWTPKRLDVVPVLFEQVEYFFSKGYDRALLVSCNNLNWYLNDSIQNATKNKINKYELFMLIKKRIRFHLLCKLRYGIKIIK